MHYGYGAVGNGRWGVDAYDWNDEYPKGTDGKLYRKYYGWFGLSKGQKPLPWARMCYLAR